MRIQDLKDPHKRTVVIITPGSLPVPPVLGGSIETVIYDIVTHSPANNYVIVSALAGGLPAIERDALGVGHLRFRNKSYDNVEIVWRNEYLVRFNLFVFRAARALRRLQPDVVHIHNMPHWAPLLRKYLGPKVKIILTDHNQKINQEQYVKNRLKNIMQAIDKLYYPSDSIAYHDILKMYPQYTDKVSTIYNCIDTTLFYRRSPQEIKQIKARLGIKTDKLILYVGRLVQEKAVDWVLRAMVKIVQLEPEAKLVIVGTSFFAEGKDTPYIASLRRLAEPIKSSVIFTGYIDNSELPALYSAAKVFIFPVLWDDPSPKTMYEAAACEAPILATLRGGIPEIVINGSSAVLLKTPYSLSNLVRSTISLLRSKRKGVRLGKAARKRMLERFTIQKITKAWEKVYA